MNLEEHGFESTWSQKFMFPDFSKVVQFCTVARPIWLKFIFISMLEGTLVILFEFRYYLLVEILFYASTIPIE